MNLFPNGAKVVVTGGRGVLGSGMAAGLRREGANVCITSRTLSEAESRAAELNAEGDGPPIIGLALDADQESSVIALRDTLLDRWGGQINGLVAAAGGNHKPEFVEPGNDPHSVPFADVWAAIEKNLKTVMLTCHVFGSTLLKQPWSSTILIGSMTGLCPLPGIAGYSAAKAAVHNYAQWLAQMYGLHTDSSDHRANAIAFGFALGDQNRDMLINPGGTWKPRGGAIASRHPAGEWGSAEDIVGPVLTMLSPVSGKGVNGSIQTVDRGFNSMTLPRYGKKALVVQPA